MSKRTRPRNVAALERRRRRHARRSAIGIDRAVFTRIFAANLGRQYDLAYAIRRRLATQTAALAFQDDYGTSLSPGDFPTAWIEMPEDPAWQKMEYRLTSPTHIEYRVTPLPIAPYINMSIGFAEPGAPLLHARAVRDAGTCHTCATMDGLPIERADSVPWGSCTSENGCRCVAGPPRE